MELRDATDISKQLAFERSITFGGYLVEAIETWLRGSKEERELLVKAVESLALTWIASAAATWKQHQSEGNGAR